MENNPLHSKDANYGIPKAFTELIQKVDESFDFEEKEIKNKMKKKPKRLRTQHSNQIRSKMSQTKFNSQEEFLENYREENMFLDSNH
eukprot:CAMPEP_0170560760 /NCGR_PEP_ID=MMETSP0211-20121228/50792_1 /TAXON_ID=311385 /ORGANISM="Pseudokeronopsis sp., Strain OXSARD2" /LENGTH=86 /DNA_ID=CAMNT_0010875379 /DNA_START=817 /DNA_END=1077 /DNA_ORIENTATION=-